MSASNNLKTLVPYLRRFARALTGTQVRGDACVVAALETLLAGKTPDIPARIALYRLLLHEVNSRAADAVTSPERLPPQVEPVQRNLSVLTPIARQAFLLVAMEEFTLQDAALVLEISADEVNALSKKPVRILPGKLRPTWSSSKMSRSSRWTWSSCSRSLGHHVVRVARTERQAIDAVLQTRPGLVLADIQLADGSSGLDAVNAILRTLPVPVIFVTAFPERLLTGTKPEPTFLVRKPYHRDALKAVISQALFFDVRSAQAP